VIYTVAAGTWQWSYSDDARTDMVAGVSHKSSAERSRGSPVVETVGSPQDAEEHARGSQHPGPNRMPAGAAINRATNTPTTSSSIASKTSRLRSTIKA
jgi:hypothetical protein